MASDEPITDETAEAALEALDPAAASRYRFRREVLPEELAYVSDRRASHGLSADGVVHPETGEPNDLAGLALSGGGIRSATFGLGVLQAFNRHRLFRRFDYLSTVSGGGFIGSSLTALMSERARKGGGSAEGAGAAELPHPTPAAFPFAHSAGGEERPTVRYLRGHSDYLAPKGLTDYVRAFALLARGIALNLTLLLPVLLIVGLLGLVLSADKLKAAARGSVWVEALAERLGDPPSADWRVILTGAPYAMPTGAVIAALESEPRLTAAPTHAASLDRLQLADGASGRQIAERLTPLGRRILAERPQVEPAGTEALIYDPAEGLELRVPRVPILRQLWLLATRQDPAKSHSHPLWTDGSPIALAAFSPKGNKIAAAGYDGSLWLFFPDDPARPESGLQRSSGRVDRRGGPIQGLSFSAEGDWLLVTASGGLVEPWWFPTLDGTVDFQSPPSLLLGHPSRLMTIGLKPPAVTAPEPAERPAWNPRRFSLPWTGWSLIGIGLTFVGLYPVVLLLGGPLGRIAAALGAVRRSVASWRHRRAFDKAERTAKRPDKRPSRAMVASRRIAFSVLLALPLFAGSINVLDKLEPVRQQSSWPWLGFLWIGLWWGLCVAFLVPVLRRWRPRKPTPDGAGRQPASKGDAARPTQDGDGAQAAPSSKPSGPDSRPRLARAAVLLLTPWLLLALAGGCFNLAAPPLDQVAPASEPAEQDPVEPTQGGRTPSARGPEDEAAQPGLAARGHRALGWFLDPSPQLPRGVRSRLLAPWQFAAVWWLACLALLWRPVFVPTAPEGGTEGALEQHRRIAWRLYAAANLLPWAYLVLAARHPAPSGTIELVIRSVAGGLDVGQGIVTRLAPLAFLGYLAGIHYFLWRLFARLGGAGTEAGSLERRAGGRPVRQAPETAGNPILWRERYEKAFSLALVAAAVVAFFEVQPYLIHYYHDLRARHSAEWLYFLTAASFVAIVLAAMFLQALRGAGQKLVLLCLGILGPLLPFLVYLSLVDSFVYGESWFNLRWLLFGPLSGVEETVRLSFLVVTVGLVAYLLGKLIDANSTGMHGFYRDRLSQGYLVGVDQDGVLGPEDELRLTEICQPGTGAPYHLLNASLNMQGEGAGAQRWRKSDFFVFSRLWCGGSSCGYCRTEDLEYLAPGVHLGSAMAVSAAAAAPNMGSYTSGALVLLMTLLNVRLGLWLPTPRRVARLAELGVITPVRGLAGRLRRWWRRLSRRPSGYALVREMTSSLDASGPSVNLSDGGHLENTGAYELLRRRCNLVVICDAESDPGIQFGSLAALMRYAAIDLGVEIDIDLDPLRPSPDGRASAHWAAGTIRYPPSAGSPDELAETDIGESRAGGGEDRADGARRQAGRLLYLKASVVGSESEIIREYRARHPDFPHESTADQVFEEDQFEAYRALGYQIGGKLAESGELEGWLAGLEPRPGRD